jgi:hypothetical protein
MRAGTITSCPNSGYHLNLIRFPEKDDDFGLSVNRGVWLGQAVESIKLSRESYYLFQLAFAYMAIFVDDCLFRVYTMDL